MTVLFVCSGNKATGISPIIKHQADSLIKEGMKVDFFLIKGKGVSAYLKHIYWLRKYLKINQYDVIHAHYSLSGFVASFAGAKKLVVSLMGSDVIKKTINRSIAKMFSRNIWPVTIVKSNYMKTLIDSKRVMVLPNGVNLEVFNCIDKNIARQKLGWSFEKKHVLFCSSPVRLEKNFDLAKKAISALNSNLNIETHYIKNIDPKELYLHYSASDVLLMTSFWEGSPNVIKEAMACNLPIVTTNVGDVFWLIGQTKGCYITDFDEKNVAYFLTQAIDFANRTEGRERIKELKIDSISIARQLIEVYKNT
jgi:teichuronic acid biosynthesis glycosyltransferase TuaC